MMWMYITYYYWSLSFIYYAKELLIPSTQKKGRIPLRPYHKYHLTSLKRHIPSVLC